MNEGEAIADALGRLLSSHISCTGYSFPQELLDLANFELSNHSLEAYLEDGFVKYRNIDALEVK